MVLNNMKRYLKILHLMGGVHYYSSGKTITLPEPIITSNGTSYTTYYMSTNKTDQSYQQTHPFRNFSSSIMTSETSSPGGGVTKVMFGSGSTPVAETDYKLESAITSGLSISSNTSFNVSYALSDDGNSLTQTVRVEYGVKNTSSASISINEVGFYENFYIGTTAGAYAMMLHREVFDTVTIESGAIASFVFDFTFTTSVA